MCVCVSNIFSNCLIFTTFVKSFSRLANSYLTKLNIAGGHFFSKQIHEVTWKNKLEPTSETKHSFCLTAYGSLSCFMYTPPDSDRCSDSTSPTSSLSSYHDLLTLPPSSPSTVCTSPPSASSTSPR